MRDLEDHVFGRAVLQPFSIDVEIEVQVLNVLDLVFRHEPGTNRTKGFAPFTLVPLSLAFKLEFTFGYIVADRVAGDNVHRLVFRKVPGAAADHAAELNFPGSFPRPFWKNNF